MSLGNRATRFARVASHVAFVIGVAATAFVAPALTAGTALAASVTRGPYLQAGTPTSVIVRWRTDTATDSRVRFGTNAAALDQLADDVASTTEHVVKLSNLAPNTRYFYSVGTRAAAVAGDGTYFFTTPPAPGTTKPTRIWVLGEAGTKNADQRKVRDAYKAFAGSRPTDLLLLLGDNAYQVGSDSDYQDALFDMYPETLRQTVVWPTIGNHDTAQSSNPPATLPYFQMFSLPKAAEAGGVPSGSENYYSFDYGNIHFVVLDSMASSRKPDGPMLTWLRNDLAANTRDWLIAYWHHPPYSKGSHDSDTGSIESDMRENALPILEAHGVDLVMSGHSHAYERSFLLDQHYGDSSTLAASNKKDGGDGRESGTGAYVKPNKGPAPHEGAVYVVAGSSGQTDGGSLNHPAMFISLSKLGSVVLDVNGNRLDAKFVRETGAVDDFFTIVKAPAPNVRPEVAITAPTDGTSIAAPAMTSIVATATDADGTITKVEFFQGSTLIGTATTPPFRTSWSVGVPGSYVLTAVATDNRRESTRSAPVRVSVTGTPVTLPAAPATLTAKAASRTEIALAWSDRSTNEEGFRIEQSRDGKTFTEIAAVPANATSFTVTGLSGFTTYHFRVRAFNAAGSSGYSNVAKTRTKLL